MKITGLKIKDFLIIKDIELSADSRLNIFGGVNRQGKTSVLKAIMAGFKGCDSSCIREGTDKSEINIDIEGLKINRVITPKANRLKVTTPAGDIKASPQTYLDSLISPFNFDLISFILLEGKERSRYLRNIFSVKLPEAIKEKLKASVDSEYLQRVNLDDDAFDALKNIENVVYPIRAEKNKQIKDKEALLRASQIDKPSVFESANETDAKLKIQEAGQTIQNFRESLSGLTDKEIKYQTAKQKEVATKQRLQDTDEALKGLPPVLPDTGIELLQKSVLEWEETIKELQNKIRQTNDIIFKDEQNREAIKGLLNYKDVLEEELESLKSPDFDYASDKALLDKQIGLQEALIVKLRSEESYFNRESAIAKMDKDLKAIKSDADKLTNVIDLIRNDIPKELMKEANLIEGLQISGDIVTYSDKNIDNLSTAEQILLSIQIVERLNEGRELKLVCLDRAESLDDESLKLFAESLPEDYQCFITIATHKGQELPDGAYTVEDGNISREEADKNQPELI